MTNSNIIKNKFNYAFILIIFSEMYYLKGSLNTALSSIDVYTSGLFNLYAKGILIILFLLMLYLLINKFDKDIVILRYRNLDLWVKEIFTQAIKNSTFIVIVVNIIPIIFTIVTTNFTIRDITVMTMYVINQIAAFYILAFIYIVLFIVNRNKIYNFIGIFFILYAPKYLLDALRKNYITPINFIFFNSDMKISNMLIQTNIMIIIAVVIAYTIWGGVFKDKYKDIIGRN